MHNEFPTVQSSGSYACASRHTAALKDKDRTERRLCSGARTNLVVVMSMITVL
jgi:hypothetical protein